MISRYMAALILSILLMPLAIVRAEGITQDPQLTNAAFWQNITPEGNAVILNESKKKAFNQKIRQKSPCMVDLAAYAPTKPAAEIRAMVDNASALAGEVYDFSGKSLTPADKAALRRQLNLEQLQGTRKISLGVVVRRANLRNLPTAEPVFDVPEPSLFDNLQETAVDPSEPVVILHASRDGAYYYVQLYDYRGWIAAADVAVVRDRSSWLNYVAPKDFLVVTEKSYTLTAGNEAVFYQMGSRLPVAGKKKQGCIVRVPQRNDDGTLAEKKIPVGKTAALSLGYLPYTRNQLLRAAFEYLDEPYGWGGLESSVDCSSLVNNVYRTVGVLLPRNADEQEGTAGQHFALAPLNEAGVYQSIRQNLKAGDTLHMDGHVMLYLGEVSGTPYVIHALGSHTVHQADGSREKQRVMKVVVSDLSLRTWSGSTFADALATGASFR